MFYRRLAQYLFVVALPLLCVSSNLRFALNESRLYEYGFEKYNVAAKTGLDKTELTKAAQGFFEYFNSTQEFIDVTVAKAGEDFTLFNEREVAHLKDVKELVQVVFRLQGVTLLYILGYIVVGAFYWRRALWRNLSVAVAGGSAFSIILLMLFAMAALFNFEDLFLQFHLLSFSNDLWMLDPNRDYLIRMFPEGFFRDSALFIALGTMLEVMILGGIAGGFIAWKRSKAIAVPADNAES